MITAQQPYANNNTYTPHYHSPPRNFTVHFNNNLAHKPPSTTTMERNRHLHTSVPNTERGLIREVWVHNLEEEMEVIRNLVEDYPFISMDTEFPGIVARPVGSFKSQTDYYYQTLRCNVDLLKIIQLGLTFSNERGELPPGTCTWQFNFKFDLNNDMYAQDSIDLLTRSGIDFKQQELHGIDPTYFGELLISSGVVLNENIKWISFHSGYDFGYLLKLLTCVALPSEESDFFELVKTYFPCVYDIKHIMKSFKHLKGGLNDLADDLKVARIGPQHQAGSDSLLTCAVFFRMRDLYFRHESEEIKYLGILYGLSADPLHRESDTASTQ